MTTEVSAQPRLLSAREYVFERDRGECKLCHLPTIGDFSDQTDVAPSVDHIREQRDGGVRHPTNLRLSHRFCNNVRAAYPKPWDHPCWGHRVAAVVRNARRRSA